MKLTVVKIGLTVLVVLCAMFMVSAISLAVPAAHIQVMITQPTGEKFLATRYGDEWLNWLTSETDDVVVKGKDNYYYYGKLENGKLVAGTAKYKIDARPSGSIKHADMLKVKKVKPTGSTPMLGITPQSGTQKMIVILVEFTNISFIYNDGLWATSFFDLVNNYYNEVSHGKFQFAPATETQGTANDGIIRVRLNYAHPDTYDVIDSRNQQLVKDALTAADPYINYASFDTNGNGAISTTELHVATVIAGFEAAYDDNRPSVWAHRWNLSGKTAVTLDGKKLCNWMYGGGYIQQGERHGDHMATIGTLCHELGHDISCPDLYDYDYDADGVGIHSLMAGGSWAYTATSGYHGSCPVHMDAYNKVGLGWVTPTVVSGSGTYTMNSASGSTDNILKVTTSLSSQYFLVENRQFTGYDAGLTYRCATDSSGILILHVDTTISNNDNELRKMVDVEEANESIIGYSQLDNCTRGVPYYHYYFTGNPNTTNTFGPTTVPNSKLYDGTNTNITISVPDASSSAMTVSVTR